MTEAKPVAAQETRAAQCLCPDHHPSHHHLQVLDRTVPQFLIFFDGGIYAVPASVLNDKLQLLATYHSYHARLKADPQQISIGEYMVAAQKALKAVTEAAATPTNIEKETMTMVDDAVAFRRVKKRKQQVPVDKATAPAVLEFVGVSLPDFALPGITSAELNAFNILVDLWRNSFVMTPESFFELTIVSSVVLT